MRWKLKFQARLFLGLLAVGVVASVDFRASAADAPASAGPVQFRRLTQEQYRKAIADTFGADIKVGGRLEPDIRPENELIAVGASQVTVTPAGFEQYDAAARVIAEQIVDPAHRELLIPCRPTSPKVADEACAAEFLGGIGRLLFRRPLSEAEIGTQLAVANEAAGRLGDFYNGLSLSLSGLLVDPNFLFRIEEVRPGGTKNNWELTPYSKAERLSFLFWNAPPDLQLLSSASRGELDTKKGLQREVDRLLASPRFETGTRAFFADMLKFEQFRHIQKEPTLYPKFSLQAAEDAREQLLRTIVEVLVTEHADYRDLFSTRKTFLTRALGTLYNVPVDKADGWQFHEFPADSPRAGILTQLGFVSLHSHAGRSSPTLRGKAVRELLLCQKVPPPPNNVDFSLVEQTDNPAYRTARARLSAHANSPACAGCHKITDPIGLSLENFDAAGEYRTHENGVAIDASGEINGKPIRDAADLGQILRNDPALSACVVKRAYQYATGRTTGSEDQTVLTSLNKKFAASGYRFPELLTAIATTDAFHHLKPNEIKAASVVTGAEPRQVSKEN